MTGSTVDTYWFDAFATLISGGSTALVYALALAYVFKPRNVAAYWATQAFCIVVLVLTKPVWSALDSITIGMVFQMLPLVFLSGTVRSRLFAFLLVELGLVALEMPCSLAWVAATGLPVMDFEVMRAHFVAYLLVVLLHTALAIALFAPAAVYFRRWVSDSRSDDRSSVNDEIASARRLQGWVAVWFLFTQLVLVWVLTWVATVLMRDDAVYMAVALCIFIACTGVDVFMLFQIRRYGDKRLFDIRADMLESQVDECIRMSSDMCAEVEHVARFRHDLRNHLQVAETMVDRGEMKEASLYLDQVAALDRERAHG